MPQREATPESDPTVTGTAQNAVLVGLGMVAEMHARAIADTRGRVRLAGVFSRDPARARDFAARHGQPHVFTAFEQILDAPGIDFVILATPPDARQAYVAALAERGLPILIEKPIERDYARAREIVALCETHGVPLGVVLQLRMRQTARELARRIAGGALGRIATVELRVPWWRDQAYYDTPGRGSYARDGGGVLITQAIHAIDLALWLCGPVTAVQGMTARAALHDMEAEDFAAAALSFANGATGSLMASVTHFPGGTEELIVNGTLASARLAGAELTIHPRTGPPEVIREGGGTGGGADPMAFTSDWHRAVIEDFAQGLAQGRPPAITGRSALPAQALIDAIHRASQTGQQVTLEPDDD